MAGPIRTLPSGLRVQFGGAFDPAGFEILSPEISITGLRDLERALLDLTPKEARRAMRQGLKAGSEIVELSALSRMSHSRDTGLLMGALKVQSQVRFAGGLLASLDLGPLSARLTQGRDTTRGSMTIKVGLYKPSPVAGRHEKHPGDPFYARWVEFGSRFVKAQPFLRPALLENKGRILSAFKNRLREAIDKLNRRKAA